MFQVRSILFSVLVPNKYANETAIGNRSVKPEIPSRRTQEAPEPNGGVVREVENRH